MVKPSKLSLLLSKTLRDYRRLLAPAIVLSLVMSTGLSALIMSRSSFISLLKSKNATYQRLRFADASLPLVHFPRDRLLLFKRFPEIKAAECRISVDGQVLLPEEKQNIQARFHTLPMEGSSPNDVRVIEGRRPKESSYHDALLSDAFARAWKINTGDWVEVLLKGRKVKLRIAGLVRSPEYVYQAGSAASIPEDRLFSVWWLSSSLLENLTNYRSSCNEVLLSLHRRNDWHALKKPLEHLLRPYGFTQLIPRSRQISNYFIESELSQLQGMAYLIPGVFLSITLFLLHITMMRVLYTQRETIGTLAAFGFPRREIFGQTFLLGVLCLLPGAFLGIILGWWLSGRMFALYLQFYRFAFAEFQFDVQSAALSVVLCIATGLLGTALAVRKILNNSPSENLKPSPPAHTRATRFDSMALFKKMGFTARMSLRNLLRRPFQTSVTIAGLSLALALLIFARFERIALAQLIEEEFEIRQRQTHTLSLTQRLPRDVIQSVRRLLPSGIVEDHLILPVVLERGNASREMTLQVDDEHQVLIGNGEKYVKNSLKNGVSLSRALSEALRIKIGDEITLTTRDLNPVQISVRVTHLNENLMGYVARMSVQDFETLWRQSRTTNTVLFRSRMNEITEAKEITNRVPTIAGISEKRFEKKVFEKTVAENIGLFENFMIGFAVLIAAGVLYNNARIQFAERQAELSLLRAVGFLESELTLIFWSDYFILVVVSFLPGLLLGRWFILWVIRGIETEMFRIPFLLPWNSYAWACLFLIFGICIAALLIQPKIRRIPFITALKTRE